MVKSHQLEDLKSQALSLMEKAGYSVTNVEIVLDEKLPFMGYTTEIVEGHKIVVSGMALSGGMALNLIIHELGHVYRMQSGHPSHDSRLILAIMAWVMQGRAVLPYQEKVLHAINNNLQDLYADDISFKIFSRETSDVDLSGFFLGWIHAPVKKMKSREDSWKNAEFLLSAAFAQSNLKRHKVKDVGEKVEKAVEDFLSQLDKRLSDKYPFFRDFMINLPEKVTEQEYEKLLIKYLTKFLQLANNV